jgi:hypothetical protein
MASDSGKRDISVDDGKKIVMEASGWQGTLYAPAEKANPYKGPGAELKKEADCSGSVWKIYQTAGFPYAYVRTADLPAMAGVLHFPIRKLATSETPQEGDIVLFDGHISIFAGHGIIWSAHKTGTRFDSFPLDYFGPILGYFRYQVDKPGA